MRINLIEIQNYLKNKNICLLGNARSILLNKKNIDKYEIIIRLNHGTPQTREEYIGNRTDILFTSTRLSDGEITQFNAKYIIWTSKDEDWRELKRNYPDKLLPSTGCIVINFLIKHI